MQLKRYFSLVLLLCSSALFTTQAKKHNNQSKTTTKYEKALANATQGVREALAFNDVPNAIGWTQGVGYQIQQQGFFNINNPVLDFGNINGIISKLDYLVDLGIESLWITQPTLGHSFYGFDTIDQKLIDPNTGTNKDFERLICEAHKRNLKIIMGAV